MLRQQSIQFVAKMVSVRFKVILVSFLIPALIRVGDGRPAFASSTASTLTGLAYKFVDKVVRPIVNKIGASKDNLTTKTLCKLNTVQKLKQKSHLFINEFNFLFLKSIIQRELIEYYNYTAEEYSVFTEDHYILTVFRCNSKKPFWGKKKKVVILQHGLITSSDGFTTNIPEHALGEHTRMISNLHILTDFCCFSVCASCVAYYLADAGFDVWLPNNRGNFYSRRHVFFKSSDPKFWDFSWFELAIYDCTAVIDFVLKETGHNKVYIIGHSQVKTTLITIPANNINIFTGNNHFNGHVS